jgi:hypothetical protein
MSVENINDKKARYTEKNEKGRITEYYYLEKWRDGTIRYVERYEAGTKINGKSVGGQYKKSNYVNKKGHRFYTNEKVGVWNKEPQQKIVPEIEHKKYVKGDMYRASISLNVPINGTRLKPNYKNFTFVVIDEKDKIDMKDMYYKLIKEIESKLHYKKDDFWFNYGFGDCDRQLPKPYNASHPEECFEGTDY